MKQYSLVFLALLSVLGACCGCRQKSGEHTGGVALSFDDRFIAEWYSLRPLFQKYGARVTFYVNGDTLTGEEVEMLHQLRRDGHEIGFHGTIHGNAAQLLEHHGPEGYYRVEIEPGITFFRRQGFAPTSYAHPGGTSTHRTDSVLIAAGLVKLREVSKSERYYKGIKLYHIPPSWMPHIYYNFDDRASLYALQIDRETDLSMAEMGRALAKAKSENTVLMLFGHQPLPPDPSPGLYGFDVHFLEKILAESQQLGLRFYTMSELR